MKYAAKQAASVLRSYKHKAKRIALLKARISTLYDQAMRATPSFTATNTSGTAGRSRVESSMVSAMDLKTQLEDSLSDLIVQRYQIQAAINEIGSDEEKILLELRYIDNRSWSQVMKEMSISETTSFRIHERALEDFWKNYSVLKS